MSILVDAAGDYLERTAALPNQDNWTAMGWFKVTDKGGTLNQTFFCLSGAVAGGPPYTWFGLTGTDDKIYLERNNNAGSILGNASDAPIAYGEWVHLAVVSASATSQKAYLNGSVVAQIVNESIWNGTPARLTMGRFRDSSTHFLSGEVADLRIWDAALSAAEVAAEKNAGSPARSLGVSIWTPGRTDTQDVSGNGRHWTEPAGSAFTYDAVSPYPVAAAGSSTSQLIALFGGGHCP